MKYEYIDDAIERLEDVISLEGSELGESWDCMIQLWSRNYAISELFL